jgi:uncharacterized protein with PhoU and TrkA domain
MDDTIFNLLIEIKDTSELMLDLAYSSLLYDNEEIAEEVLQLEEMCDNLNQEIQNSALRNALEDKNVGKAKVIIQLANNIERVADSAADIADIVLRDIDPHPVFKLSLMESDVIITKLKVMPGSKLNAQTIGSVQLASKTGMWVIAIKRGNRWVYGPDENAPIAEGDEIFARGPIEGKPLLLKLCGIQPVEEE